MSGPAHSEPPTYELSGFKLSKIQMCIRKSSHVSSRVYNVKRVHALQVFLPSLYGVVYSTGVQCLYFKPRMSRSKGKSSCDVAGTSVLFQDTVLLDLKCLP